MIKLAVVIGLLMACLLIVPFTIFLVISYLNRKDKKDLERENESVKPKQSNPNEQTT